MRAELGFLGKPQTRVRTYEGLGQPQKKEGPYAEGCRQRRTALMMADQIWALRGAKEAKKYNINNIMLLQ